MEGAVYLVLKLILLGSVAAIVASLRLLLWSLGRAKRNWVDAGLLVIGLVCSGLGFLVSIADLTRGTGTITNLVQHLALTLPIAATLVAQVAMFFSMRKDRVSG